MWYLQQQQQVNIIVATMASKNQYCGPTQGWKHHQRQRFGNEWYLYQTILFEYTVNLYDVFLYLGVIQFCQIATKEHIIQQMEDNDIMMEWGQQKRG